MSAVDARPAVPVMSPVTRDEEMFAEMMAAIERIARKGAFTLGEEVEQFEAEYAAWNETAHCVGVSSGTEALELAIRALDIGAGDECIVPTNSFIATAEAVSLAGATPVFIDVDPETHLITAEAVEAAITERTKCVLPVHLMGSTVDMEALLAVTKPRGIRVVEDTAQGHGARVNGKRVGTFGDIGCFSFYPTKNLGAWGDGGAIVTADAELDDKIRLLRAHGERPRYHHMFVGKTARLDAIQAAVLRIKLRELDAVTDERRRLGAMLREGLKDTSLGLPAPACEGADHVYHLFIARCTDREALREFLAERGVNSAVHYPVPIHRVEAYADLGFGPGSLPVAERLAEEIVTLPLFPGMEDDAVARVIDGVREFDRRNHAGA